MEKKNSFRLRFFWFATASFSAAVFLSSCIVGEKSPLEAVKDFQAEKYMGITRYNYGVDGGLIPSGYGKPTPYTARRASIFDATGMSEYRQTHHGNGSWWLRSHYATQFRGPVIRAEGSFDVGVWYKNEEIMVRPSLWIKEEN